MRIKLAVYTILAFVLVMGCLSQTEILERPQVMHGLYQADISYTVTGVDEEPGTENFPNEYFYVDPISDTATHFDMEAGNIVGGEIRFNSEKIEPLYLPTTPIFMYFALSGFATPFEAELKYDVRSYNLEKNEVTGPTVTVVIKYTNIRKVTK